jgi:hypothetical protein
LVTPAGRVAVVFEPSGTAGYDDLVRGATTIELYRTAVLVASLADVIRSVAAVGRVEDRPDLLLLQQLASEGNNA